MERVLLFDYDGVVADSLPVVVGVYNDLFAKYGVGLHYTSDEFSRFYIANFHEALKERIPADILPKILEEKGEIFTDCAADFKIFDGMKETLEKLSASNHVIIISSNTTKFIQENMRITNLPAFEVLGGDYEPSKVKKIRMQKERFPGKEIIYIGDTVGDVKEAKEAGVIAVAAAWGFHHKDLLAKESPDYLFEKPEELLKFL